MAYGVSGATPGGSASKRNRNRGSMRIARQSLLDAGLEAAFGPAALVELQDRSQVTDRLRATERVGRDSQRGYVRRKPALRLSPAAGR